MSKITILQGIRELKRPVFTTRELAAVTGHTLSSVSQSLRRLAGRKMITRLSMGLWADTHNPEFSPLTATMFLLPRQRVYVSFVSALHLHGIISQIPQVITLASTGHSRIIRTSAGIYELHQITPSFFAGFDWYRGAGKFLVAEPEKALVDCLYLASRKGRRYAHFPELDFPRDFSRKKTYGWVKKIADRKIRVSVENKLRKLLG